MANNTLVDARISGMVAAMDSSFSGEIPADFNGSPAVRAEWIEAYNSMAVTLDQRCYSPDMEHKPRRAARQKAAKPAAAAPSAPVPQARKTMMAILEGSFSE